MHLMLCAVAIVSSLIFLSPLCGRGGLFLFVEFAAAGMFGSLQQLDQFRELVVAAFSALTEHH